MGPESTQEFQSPSGKFQYPPGKKLKNVGSFKIQYNQSWETTSHKSTKH